MSVTYQTQIINPDGSIAKSNPPTHNLLLDGGLDLVASDNLMDLFRYAVVGTGSTPTNRDSASTTFTRSGTTVTANANFFEAADVGRLLKFDSGEEMYITAFTSATEVTVDTGGTLSASEGTVWYVNEVGHETESKRTATYGSDSGDNGRSVSGNIITNKRTYIFSAEVGAVTYTEIGWSNVSTPSAQLFGRDLIAGGGDSLSAGQQYKVIFQLQTTLSPVDPTAVSDVGNNGFNTAGTFCFEYLFRGLGYVSSTGAATYDGSNENSVPEPKNNHEVSYADATFTQLSGLSTSFGTPGSTILAMTAQSYTSGSFTRTYVATASISQWNDSIYGLIFGSQRLSSVLFTTAQTKDSDHKLTVTYRWTWGRTLVN